MHLPQEGLDEALDVASAKTVTQTKLDEHAVACRSEFGRMKIA